MFLITGANGQLGSELRELLTTEQACFTDYQDLDICNEEAVAAFVAAGQFSAIINCAAYTAVDAAEDNEEQARRINVDGPANLAKTGLPIIQVSTDYVFDGLNHRPYLESDATGPVSVYGVTKLDGEMAVLEHAETAIIIRTAWLYSSFGNNFVKTMQRLGAERQSLQVVWDQVGTPCYAADLAQAIVSILPQIKQGQKEIYHYSNEGVCSWYDFAREIMEISELPCEVYPIPAAQYPTKATRPSYSVLDKAKIKADFQLTIPHWKQSLTQCISKLKAQ
ncbi:MAG: dTDP-4-dehydrorhamnose reductase [Akkermansia sp.]